MAAIAVWAGGSVGVIWLNENSKANYTAKCIRENAEAREAYEREVAAQAEADRKAAEAKRVANARKAAWEKVTDRLGDSNREAHHLIWKYERQVRRFFRDKEIFAHDFAKDVLGWASLFHWGKDQILKGGEHEKYIRESFARHLFRGEDLKTLLDNAVEGFEAELDGLDARLLVELRADLPDSDLAALGIQPAFASDESLRAEFKRLREEVTRLTNRDVAVVAGREAVNWTAGGLLTATALRMAVSSGLIKDASFFSARSMTIVLIVGFALDTVLRWIIHEAGYDPEKEVVEQVHKLFNRLTKLLVEGDPDGKTPGLRAGLLELYGRRARLREAALKKLIFGL
jgi:hypothetical protein